MKEVTGEGRPERLDSFVPATLLFVGRSPTAGMLLLSPRGRPKSLAAPSAAIYEMPSRERMKNLLDFEKPIFEIQTKLEELRKQSESLGVSAEQEIKKLEQNLAETKKQIFENLTAWQRVQMARHPKRPFTLDYLQSTFTDFNELHGDRLYAEDRALLGGFARLGDHKVMVIARKRGGTRRRIFCGISVRRIRRVTARRCG